VTIRLDHLLVFSALCASAHWIIARSKIAEPLWSRAKGWVAELLACTGCSGFWLGGGLTAAGFTPIDGIPLWARIIAGGLLGAFVTPVAQAVLLWGLRETAIEETPDETRGG
jgi:hypothetical protein